MAKIDVTELLTDPDFVDQVSIITRSSRPNEYGENVLKEYVTHTIGSVQPASGKTLQRLPEALRVVNVSSFWIKGKINADGSCQYPDILVFGCKRYQVQVVLDYENWGQGWVEGTCVAERPAG